RPTPEKAGAGTGSVFPEGRTRDVDVLRDRYRTLHEHLSAVGAPSPVDRVRVGRVVEEEASGGALGDRSLLRLAHGRLDLSRRAGVRAGLGPRGPTTDRDRHEDAGD